MIEYFASPKKEKTSEDTIPFDGIAQVKAKLNGKEVQVSIDDDTTILDALIKKGANPPFSCSSGACSTCMAKLTKGTVDMDSCYSLEEEELSNGIILTCQAHPTSEAIELDYDVIKK